MLKLTETKYNQIYKIIKFNFNLDSHYFKSIGIGIEDQIEVIRKALFNGSLHIKNNLNAEFAIDYQTAESIYVIEI
jgi:Fe2+ transport system protein FeoA